MTDATVVGSGPNGLSAALTLARAGLSVRVLEAADTVGGGLRTSELTLPGFRHDVCSAVHPAALASPFFTAFGLRDRVDFAIPEIAYAHAVDEARVAVAYHDLDRTAEELGVDGPAWRRLLAPLAARIDGVVDFTGSQLLRIPDQPGAAIRYGLRVLEQGTRLGGLRFREDLAPALFAGVVAHANLRQPSLAAAGAGLLLAAHAHAYGWGIPLGGSQAIADAMAEELRAAGGTIETGIELHRPEELDDSRIVMLDTSPEFLLDFCGELLPPRYRRAVTRFRHGSGVAKLDAALSGPIPWRDERLASALTVHLSGSRQRIAAAESAVAAGRHPDHPYIIVVQPSIADPSRAPAGQQVLWAYTHVPFGSDRDPTELILAAIEEHAPGFRDTVLASVALSASELVQRNPNDIGGDIFGGALTLGQLVARPIVSARPWRTPVRGLYLCSASTPPGPSVHGMSGWYAARLALRELYGIRDVPYA